MVSFDLVDSPWIRYVLKAGGAAREGNLREVLTLSDKIEEIAEASPLVTVAIHRLLLAIIHRAIDGPKTSEQWTALWSMGALPIEPVERYLNEQRDRGNFDLFHPTRPFYQTTNLDFMYETTVAS